MIEKDISKFKGKMVAEMLLPCRTFPLRRGRTRSRRYKGVYQPLGDQEEMMEQMIPHRSLSIDFPFICEIYCGYRVLYTKNQYQPDIKLIAYDVDNLTKAVLDNMQRMRIILDDKLAVGVTCLKYQDYSDCTTIRLYVAEGYNYGQFKTLPD